MIELVRKSWFPIVGILFVAFVVRLHGFTSPVGDWHSWRQADTSAVSRNYVNQGINLLYPTSDDISNVPSKLDNPHGYRFVEFPLYNVLQALSAKWIGIITLEEWGRLITIIASLIATFFLYRIVTKFHSRKAGLFTAFFYAFLPFNIYYGRTILPDQSMATAVLVGIYYFSEWIDTIDAKKRRLYWKNFSLALVATMVAFLLKPYAIFFILPMVYLVWKKFSIRSILQWQLWVFMIVSFAPLLLWRQWMSQFPEGIPANSWLLNGNGIRFRPAFFRWMVYERLIKLLSGYVGIIFLAFGSYVVMRLKEKGFFLSFLVSSVLYVCVFASGNVQHDYYQILIMPSLTIFMGLGAEGLQAILIKRIGIVGRGVVVLLIALSFFFSWNIVKDYFNINNPDMITVGAIVDKTTPKDAQIVALYNGDTSFLYQTKRKGWANMQDPIPVLITKGADYLVLLHPSDDDVRYFSKGYRIVSSSPSYVLIQLH